MSQGIYGGTPGSGVPGISPSSVHGGIGPPPPTTPSTPVELSVSAIKLLDMDIASPSDPICILSIKLPEKAVFTEVARTEIVKDNLNPNWVTKLEIDYRFEERQLLQFSVYDYDDDKSADVIYHDKLGDCEVTLAEIMARGGDVLTIPLRNSYDSGKLVVSGEEKSLSKEVVTLKFAATGLDKKDFFGKSDPYLLISRAVGNGGHYTAVHKTEYYLNTLNPTWKPIIIKANLLCGGDPERSLKIECFDWNSNSSPDLIGECRTTLAELRQAGESGSAQQYQLINPKKKAKKRSYVDSGKLILHSCSVHVEPTFLDYIGGGTQLHFTVAVDFTASNGDPRLPTSLHFWNPNQENQYEMAIRAVGEIIQDYDSDKQFPALGFGGKVPPHYQVSHEFFLNLRPDTPYCAGVEGILAAYRHSLSSVQLYGPTNFAPVINHVAQFARSLQDGKNYFVLLIITDGIITDLPQTKQAIVAASDLPMSIIIIGVGSEDFSAMEQLDGDEHRLSYNGRAASRDIVQFVALYKHLSILRTNPAAAKSFLARDVLAELPQQVVQWMRMRNIAPQSHASAPPL